jgi:hypothetical protein
MAKSIHDYRILGLSIVDYILTFIGVIILHSYMWFRADVKNKRTFTQYILSFTFIFITMLGLGTILHYFFNVKSAFSRILGLND